MSETKCPRLLFAPAQGHPGDGRNHDAGRDQRVLADHVRWHSNVIASNKSQQQRCRRGSHHTENQVDDLAHLPTMTQSIR